MDVPELVFHLTVEEHLFVARFLVIRNKTSINISIEFVWVYVPINLGKYLGNRIAGLYSKCMFNFIKSCRTVFQSGYPSLHAMSPARYRNSVAPHSHEHLVLWGFCFCFCLFSLLEINVYWFVVLTYISLMTSDPKHLFRCYLPSAYLFLMKYLLKSCSHFKIVLFLIIEFQQFFTYSGHRLLIRYISLLVFAFS